MGRNFSKVKDAAGSDAPRGAAPCRHDWRATVAVILAAFLYPVKVVAQKSAPFPGGAELPQSAGELRLFFPGCRAVAAPVLLFRLKREGYSSCRVNALPEGLAVTCRR